MARVVIEVEGGMIANVYADCEDVTEYVIIDRDVQELGEDYIERGDLQHAPSDIEAEIAGAS